MRSRSCSNSKQTAVMSAMGRSGPATSGGTSTLNAEQTFMWTNLSGENLKLLGIMEGEIQAREDVIRVLKSALLSGSELYSSARPCRTLRRLQTDRPHGQAGGHGAHHHMRAQLDRLCDQHQKSYQQMLQQLSLLEKSHWSAVRQLDLEKRKHVDYMKKSDDFTNLLEQECERLKRLLNEEKTHHMQKEKEFCKIIQKTFVKLIKLKSFAIIMIKEQEVHCEDVAKKSLKIQQLLQLLREKDEKILEAEKSEQQKNQKILELEAELKQKTLEFTGEREEMSVKLSTLESQIRRKLQLQTERQETSQNPQKSALKEISLAEKSYHNSRLQLEELQHKLTQLETLVMHFSLSKTECERMQADLDEEKSRTKNLRDKVVGVQIRVKELQSTELKLEQSELDFKQDLVKLKSLTVILANQHANMAVKAKAEETRNHELSKLFKSEQEKVLEMTERLMEESRMRLELKSEVELKTAALIKERDNIKATLVEYIDLNSRREHSVGIQMEEDKELLGVCSAQAACESKPVQMKNNSPVLKASAGDTSGKAFSVAATGRFLLEHVQEIKSRLSFQEDKRQSHVLMEELQVCETELLPRWNRHAQDYSVLGKKFPLEDTRWNVYSEVFNLTRELKLTRCFSHMLWPCSRFDIPKTHNEVQTSFQNGSPEELVRKSEHEEFPLMRGYQPSQPVDVPVTTLWISRIKRKGGPTAAPMSSEPAPSIDLRQQGFPLHVQILSNQKRGTKLFVNSFIEDFTQNTGRFSSTNQNNRNIDTDSRSSSERYVPDRRCVFPNNLEAVDVIADRVVFKLIPEKQKVLRATQGSRTDLHLGSGESLRYSSVLYSSMAKFSADETLQTPQKRLSGEKPAGVKIMKAPARPKLSVRPIPDFPAEIPRPKWNTPLGILEITTRVTVETDGEQL